MQILLDTHIALWAVTDHPSLNKTARDLINNPANIIIVSTVSLWEIAIKHKLARGDMPIDSANALQYFKAAGYELLSILPEHVIATAELPAHHQDPFDRLLIAQALQEPLRLITHDKTIALYSDTVILVWIAALAVYMVLSLLWLRPIFLTVIIDN